MKNLNHKYFAYLTIAFSVLLTACGDEEIYFTHEIPAPENATNIKFLHAASDAVGVNFYVDNAKVSSGAAINSSIALAAAFPSVNYSTFASGSHTIKAVVPATLTTPENVLVTADFDTQAGKSYTIALAGVTPSYEVVTIEDDFSSVEFNGKTYVRFVNLIHNSTNPLKIVATINVGTPPVPVINVITDVTYKEATPFIALDPGDYTIQLRDAVTDALLASADATSKNIAGNRTYTLFARGTIAAPKLDRMINR